MQRFLFVLLCAAAQAAAGCGDDHAGSHGDDSTHDGGHHDPADAAAPGSCGLQDNCSGDEVTPGSDAEPIDGNMGNFSLEFHAASEFMPADEGTRVTADWVIVIRDADGDPVNAATLTVSTWSVDCLHKGPTPDEIVEANQDERYNIHSVYAHGGPWETRIIVEAGDTTDMIHVPVCSPGSTHGGEHSGAAGHEGDSGTADGHDGHGGDA